MAWGGGGALRRHRWAARRPGASAPGLPFGGIPSELQSGVDELLARGAGPRRARRSRSASRPTRRTAPADAVAAPRRVPGHARAGRRARRGLASVMQAGPKLTEIAINDGMSPGHENFAVVVLVRRSSTSFRSLVSAVAQRARSEVTGRLAAWVMNDLRVKVFTHLQRLSLDFFTRREGRRAHDPDDERHREPPAAPPGRPGAVRHPGPDDDRHHGHPLHHSTSGWPSSPWC